jgi:hypothetical protein
MLFGNLLDLRLHMAGRDEEPLRHRPHLLVLLTRQRDAFGTGLEAALADECDRFGRCCSGGGCDGLVDVSEESLVLADAGSLIGTHVSPPLTREAQPSYSDKGQTVVGVRFADSGNLTSCENFLQHAFPGTIEREDDRLELTLRGTLAPGTERRVVERLLWAWRQYNDGVAEDGIIDDPGEPA